MKSNIVKRKLTNGPRVTAEKMRFVWRGGGKVTWEDAARLCYKRPNSSGGDHEKAPEARGGTTSEAIAPQSGPQVSVPRLLLPARSVLLNGLLSPPSQKPTWWRVLILWLVSCSSSPSKAVGSFPSRTETPCKINVLAKTNLQRLQKKTKLKWQLFFNSCL